MLNLVAIFERFDGAQLLLMEQDLLFENGRIFTMKVIVLLVDKNPFVYDSRLNELNYECNSGLQPTFRCQE